MMSSDESNLSLHEDPACDQRVEIYLSNLKNRLTELRADIERGNHTPHKILQDIHQVSASMLESSHFLRQQDKTSIKKLIQEFEEIKHAKFVKKFTPIETHVNIKALLETFEQLHLTGRVRSAVLED